MSSAPLTLGKLRGIQALADERGIFSILACDQRGAMIRLIREARPGDPSYDDVVRAKLGILRKLTPLATGALLDPEYALAAGLRSGALAGHCGLAVSIEKSAGKTP